MSLSYSALVNNGKVTLPSVSSWGTNMNILRDPPKSITTRRIDKISETSELNQILSESGDRTCEVIQVYNRGVNPSVSVSYSNYGNNGGQQTSGIINTGQAKLPYTIMRDGAFRPPVLFGENLLPLSRLPRELTSVKTKASFIDFSRKIRSCGTAENTREVKTHMLKAHVRPTAVYRIEKPIREPFSVKYNIQSTINNSVNSGMRAMDITNQVVGKPTKEIDIDPLHAHAQSNIVGTKRVSDNRLETSRYLQDPNHYNAVTNISSIMEGSIASNNTLDTNRYLQDANYHAVGTNISSSKHSTAIEDVLDLSSLPVKNEIINVSANAGIRGTEQNNYVHDDIYLDRRLPEYQASTNLGDTATYKHISHENELQLERRVPMTSFSANPVAKSAVDPNSRQARLQPKIHAGGFEGKGQMPMIQRAEHGNTSGISEKARMNSMVFNTMQSRYGNPPPFM
jgi:hypothetical protein